MTISPVISTCPFTLRASTTKKVHDFSSLSVVIQRFKNNKEDSKLNVAGVIRSKEKKSVLKRHLKLLREHFENLEML